MHPVLISTGNFSLSAFGLLLCLGFFVSVFVVWRLARVNDVNEERIIDLCLLTAFAAIFGSRLVFVLLNLAKYDSFNKIVLINRYPGLSFWGGAGLSAVVVYLLCRKFKLAFWQVADFAVVGLFAGLIFGSFGCLLSSCQYGIVSDWPLSVSQAGLIGDRFPVQLLAALSFGLGYWFLWRMSLRFHFAGRILSLGLILLGLIKFLTAFLRADSSQVVGVINWEHLLGLATITLGIWVYYQQSKRDLVRDLKLFFLTFRSSSRRKLVLLKLKKSWYNLQVNLKFGLHHRHRSAVGGFKKYLKRINVKHKPPQF